MPQKFSRSAEIDIVRGIGIILVVLLHVGIPSWFWTNYFNLFHMAVFIFSAGWCFNGKLLEEKYGCRIFIKKKLKSLYVPYVLFNSAMIIFNNLFIKINIYTDKAAFLEEQIGIGNAFGLKTMLSANQMLRQIGAIILGGRQGEPQLGGTTWFLRALFIISVMFFFLQKIIQVLAKLLHISLRDIIIQTIFSILFLFIGWEASKNGVKNDYQIFTCASIYFVYVAGWLTHKLDIIGKLKRHIFISAASAISCSGLLIIAGNNASISVNSNQYTNPFWLFCGSMSGSFLCICIAVLTGKISNGFARIIRYIGTNSLTIMLFHFLAFKCITFIEIIYFDKPTYLLAAFPTLYTDGIWRWLYVLAGLLLPLAVHTIYKLCARNFRHRQTKVDKED